MQASASAGMWLDDEWQATLTRRLSRAVAISLALHIGLLFIVTWVRVPRQVEQPLASIEISLASLPTHSVKVLDSPKDPQKNQQTQKITEPSKAVEPPPTVVPPPKIVEHAKAVEQPKAIEQTKVFEQPRAVEPLKAVAQPKSIEQPKPTPPAPIVSPPAKASSASPPVAPTKSSNDVMREMLKDIELPPEAPQYGDISPVEKPKKTQLKLPDVPVIPESKDAREKAADYRPSSSLTEDVSKELDEELKKIKRTELPKTPAVASVPNAADIPSRPAPQVEAKVQSAKAIDTTLKVPGMAPGSNAYLALVRQRISSFWAAPPVDISSHAYVVIVQFRLHKNGSVTSVVIEQSSGNEYYDLAGKRAVLSATPLPKFPADITEAYFDAHFTFTVGESRG